MATSTEITVSIEARVARLIVRRAGGWQDEDGRWNFGGGAAEHLGPYWQLDEALAVALQSIAAGAALDA